MKHNFFIKVFLLCSILLISACSKNNNESNFKPIKMRFANQHPKNSVASEADYRICNRIEKETDGRVKIELYTDSSLGDYSSLVQELMMGTIEMCHISAPENYDPRFASSMLPYLGSNYNELKKVYDRNNTLYKSVYTAAQNIGIHTFGIFCEGFSGIGTSIPIENASVSNKNKDVLVRVPSLDSFALTTRRLGFKTSTIPYVDTYTAIQTGTVNGWMGGPPNLNYLYFRDVIKYYYHYMITQEATQIMMNEKVFQSLLPKDQEIITKIIQEECDNSFDAAIADDMKYMNLMKDYGINIVEFSDEERYEFAQDIRKNVWPELAKTYGKDYLDQIIESIR